MNTELTLTTGVATFATSVIPVQTQNVAHLQPREARLPRLPCVHESNNEAAKLALAVANAEPKVRLTNHPKRKAMDRAKRALQKKGPRRGEGVDALPHPLPPVPRDGGGGWRDGGALSTAPRHANPMRVPPTAVRFWQQHAHLAPSVIEMGMSYQAFEVPPAEVRARQPASGHAETMTFTRAVGALGIICDERPRNAQSHITDCRRGARGARCRRARARAHHGGDGD